MALTDDFKDALSRWASGVSVVTTNEGGLLYGLTVSSFTSVSLDPPLVLVCLANTNRLPAMIGASKRFAVSVLSDDQVEASNYFASPGREPTKSFVEVEGEWTALEQPMVTGAIAHVVCELHRLIPAGDHTVVIGRVVHADAEVEGTPLVYWNRGYRSLAD